MKWLLITTAKRTPETLNSNVGDEFACIGTENLIRDVDPEAEFDYIDVENPATWDERPFDRCVAAGRPLWWSQRPGTDCVDHFWWGPIMRGWPTADKRRFMVLGGGSVQVGPLHNPRKYWRGVAELRRRAWAVTTRSYVHHSLTNSVCPSAFAVLFRRFGGPRVCNLMPEGGHFPIYEPDVTYWNQNVLGIAEALKRNGYEFVAHVAGEREYAKALGWPEDRIRLFSSAKEYLDYYARASAYFGNRLHGGAICASVGIPTFCVTYDSRLAFVARLGAIAKRPTTMGEDWREWIDEPDRHRPNWCYNLMLRVEHGRLIQLLGEFAG